jgi:hypothetical protein
VTRVAGLSNQRIGDIGESGKSNQLPKEVQIVYPRIPVELRCELDAMPQDKMIRVREALNKFHAMETEVYEVTLFKKKK